MKKTLLILSMLALAAVAQAQVISEWTFETNTPADANNTTTGPSSAADVGNGTATGFHASANSDWSTPTGNGSANSYSVNTWAIGDYFQFSLSTVGQNNIFVTFSQASSTTGPTGFELLYSSNGGTSFTSAGGYTVHTDATSWGTSTGSFVSADEYTFDLSGVLALNNNASVVFRLSDTTAPSSAAGTSRVDNFFVSANAPEYPPGFVAVPEPATWMLMGVGLLLGAQRLRRKS